MHRICAAGLVCVDLRPDLGESARFAPGRLIEIGAMSMRLGGMIGNTGQDLLDLGVPLRLECAVGDDELGRYVRDSLQAHGADISGVRSAPGASTSYSLILEPHGVDRTIWHSIGANATFDGRDVELEGIDLLHVGYPALLPALVTHDASALDSLLSRARSAGVTTSVDLSYIDTGSAVAELDWLQILSTMASQTDVLSPSLDDLTSALRINEPFSEQLIDRMLSLLLDRGVAVAAISAGEQGLFMRTAGAARLLNAGRALRDAADQWADREVQVPPVWLETPVTTNGAGDATSAGLLLGIGAGFGPDESARLAAACSGALVSGRMTTIDVISELCPELAGQLSRINSEH